MATTLSPRVSEGAAPPLHPQQRRKLAAMLAEILPGNAFYRRKLAGIRFDAQRDSITNLPFTTRGELEADQRDNPPYGTNLSYPPSRYSRMHQTSGSTSGAPLRWLDTAESWRWWQDCWRTIYSAAGISAADRLVFPFSFGPFAGFWGAFESAASMGALCLAAGGMTSGARLQMILDNAATVVCCTPTYALRLAEVAAEQKLNLARSSVRALVVAGEPGGSIPAVRRQIEAAWGARVFDHCGMTEIGPLGFECQERPLQLHVNEDEFIVEVIHPLTTLPVDDGETGELVVTNLGRLGSPVIRYRTGDRVVLRRGMCACGRDFAVLDGGILGRVDEMFVVRGTNVFPSALEAALRQFPEIAEFRVIIRKKQPLVEVSIQVEPAAGLASASALVERVAEAIHDRFHFRAEVVAVAPGSLPRFEMKARRFVREETP